MDAALQKEMQVPTTTTDGALQKEMQVPTTTTDGALQKEMQVSTSTADAALQKEMQVSTTTTDGALQEEVPVPTTTTDAALQKEMQVPITTTDTPLQKEFQNTVTDMDSPQHKETQTSVTMKDMQQKEIAIDVDPAPPNASRRGPSPITRLQRYFSAEVTTARADILMLTCCFISGLVDSTVYNAYGTFVSMQTGNTIFLGLGGATPHDTSKPYGWAKSLLSIGCFFVGCFTFSMISRLLTPLRRSTLIISFFLQSIMIFIAAGIIEGPQIQGDLLDITDDIDWEALWPIAILSFQSAGQIVGSRVLGLAEVPTVVLTSMLHDVATDPALLDPLTKNVKRNRRVLAFFTILIGAVAGGFVSEKTGRMQDPLWMAAGVKVGVAGAFMVWPKKRTSQV